MNTIGWGLAVLSNSIYCGQKRKNIGFAFIYGLSYKGQTRL
jgi:hypothetical protein